MTLTDSDEKMVVSFSVGSGNLPGWFRPMVEEYRNVVANGSFIDAFTFQVSLDAAFRVVSGARTCVKFNLDLSKYDKRVLELFGTTDQRLLEPLPLVVGSYEYNQYEKMVDEFRAPLTTFLMRFLRVPHESLQEEHSNENIQNAWRVLNGNQAAIVRLQSTAPGAAIGGTILGATPPAIISLSSGVFTPELVTEVSQVAMVPFAFTLPLVVGAALGAALGLYVPGIITDVTSWVTKTPRIGLADDYKFTNLRGARNLVKKWTAVRSNILEPLDKYLMDTDENIIIMEEVKANV